MVVFAATASNRCHPGLQASPAHQRPRILVAADDDDVRHLVASALCSDENDVVQISDGGRLLAALARQFAAKSEASRSPVNLLILDTQSPDGTGMQLLEQIRAEGWRVPAIWIAWSGNAGTRERAAELGALLLPKPLDVVALRIAVADLLRA